MKCVYIYNPNSGKGKSLKFKDYIINQLKTKYDDVDVLKTTQRGDAIEFAKNACGNYDCIVCSGGDGTISEIINGIANEDNKPIIGYIPTGTVNDLAHSIGIPKNIKKAVKIILNGNTIKHDVFKLNNKYGIYVAGFGIFTECSYTAPQKNKRKIGKLAYYFSGAKELFHAHKFNVKVTTPETNIDEDIILGLIVNSKYVSGYKINKMASHNDGHINLVLFKEKHKKGVSLRMLFNIARLFLFGMTTLKNSKNCIILKLNKCDIILDETLNINVDGEKSFAGPFTLEVLKQHVDIFVK